MIDTAIIMAGGRGTRMQASGAALPKPLVTVRGVALLERNLYKLLQHGVRRIFVSVNAGDTEIRAFIDGRLRRLALTCGATLTTLEETVPLGNIGAIALLPAEVDRALVVYADNLTSLDLTAFARFHRSEGTVLTIAAHNERFRMPYGEVQLDAAGTRMTDYLEKPAREVLVCSALAVIERAAIAAVPKGRSYGISELCHSLAPNSGVAVYHHSADWIDVNDTQAQRRAEAMLANAPIDFDIWAPAGVPRQDVALFPKGKVIKMQPMKPSKNFNAPPRMVFDDIGAKDGTLLRCHVTFMNTELEGPTTKTAPPHLATRARIDLSPVADTLLLAAFDKE